MRNAARLDLRFASTMVCALSCAPACAPALDRPERELAIATEGRGLGTFSEVTSFGANPGALRMYKYVPSPAPAANAPLVLALHACSQTANDYQKAGWNSLADEWGFYILYPEQQTANNALRCFNWAGEYSDPTNLRRGEGENQSIVNMIDQMKQDHSIDARRVFVMGHSGGAAQTALMLATWPDVFAGGAMIAGIPYNCTTSFTEVTTCLNPGINRTAQQWGDRARAGDMGYSGPWPRVSIWHGTSDTTVNPANGTELLEQWTDVHGIDTTPDAMDTVDGFPHREYKDGAGDTKVEYYEITGMNHGTPVVPGQGCGMTGAYFLDVGICGSRRIGEFFGIDTGSSPGDTTAPTVNVTAPGNGMTVRATVTVRVDAADNTAVERVELFVNGSLEATLTNAPYTYNWDTSREANGTYVLRAVAYDAAGNSASDEDTTVTVDGGVVDMMPPTVDITSPRAGDTVSGSVSITANATDNFGVARVEFSIDGAPIGEATQSPYTISWDTTSVAPGSHALSARAFDSAGNVATDDDTSVTVMMSAMDTTPPVVSIRTPNDGATVSGLIQVELEASDNVGLKTGLLFLGDELIGSDYREPFEFLWDTSTFPEGPHKLTARVFDIAGNPGVAEIDVTVEHTEGENPEPDPGDEPVVIGQRHWGCSTTSSVPSDSAAVYLLLAAFVFVIARSSKKENDR